MNCVWDVRYRTEPTGITQSPFTHDFLHVADTQHRQPQGVANFPLATTTNNKFSVANENPRKTSRYGLHLTLCLSRHRKLVKMSVPFLFRSEKQRKNDGKKVLLGMFVSVYPCSRKHYYGRRAVSPAKQRILRRRNATTPKSGCRVRRWLQGVFSFPTRSMVFRPELPKFPDQSLASFGALGFDRTDRNPATMKLASRLGGLTTTVQINRICAV